MTADEIDEVIALWRANWPRHTLSPEADALWASIMAPLDSALGLAAARMVLTSCDEWPSAKRFRELYGDAYRAAEREAGAKALPGPRPAPVEAGLAWAGAVKALAQEVAASLDRHDHRKGRGSCPVCRLHDHSDRRPVRSATGDLVPRWHLTCPRCGELAMERRLADLGVDVARPAVTAGRAAAPSDPIEEPF